MKSFSTKQNKKSAKNEGSWPPVYEEIPDYDFSIDEIVSLAVHRHRLHEGLEFALQANEDENAKRKGVRETMAKYGIPMTSTIVNTVGKNIISPEGVASNFSKLDIDRFGFFALLFVSLRSEESIHEFIKMEKMIFSYRIGAMESLTIDALPKCLFENDKSLLLDIGRYTDAQQRDQFRIPFELVFPHIDVTTVDVQNGYACIKLTDLRPMFATLYQLLLVKRCRELRENRVHETDIFEAATAMYDEYIGAFVTNKDRSSWTTLSYDDVDVVARRSFPPCMYNMYTKLKQNHKLFHDGRLQFGLFLKGIGLSLGDSLKLWGSELSKIVGIDGFEKQYAYNIRYNYGKEGSGKSRAPYSCMGMIKRPPPAAGQTHGCPLRQLREEESLAVLKSMAAEYTRISGKNPPAMQEKLKAAAFKGREHPQIACAEIYNLFHDTEFGDTAVIHPCDYYSRSEEAEQQKNS